MFTLLLIERSRKPFYSDGGVATTRASLTPVRNRAGIETRERILTATKRLLAERGLDGVTIKGICDAADVHAGSFYNLFESKEQVVLTAVRDAIRAVAPDPGDQHLWDLMASFSGAVLVTGDRRLIVEAADETSIVPPSGFVEQVFP